MCRRSKLLTAAVTASVLSAALLVAFLGLGAARLAPDDGQVALAAAGFSVYLFYAAAGLWGAVAVRSMWRRCGCRPFRA